MHKALNCYECFVAFVSDVSGCVSISAFGSLICVPVGIASSAVGNCASTAWIKKHKPIVTNQEKKRGRIVLLVKTKSNSVEVLISKALINSYTMHDEFVSVKNVLREYNEMRNKLKILKLLSLCNTLYKITDLSRASYVKNGVEAVVDNDDILWLMKNL